MLRKFVRGRNFSQVESIIFDGQRLGEEVMVDLRAEYSKYLKVNIFKNLTFLEGLNKSCS